LEEDFVGTEFIRGEGFSEGEGGLPWERGEDDFMGFFRFLMKMI